MAEREKKKIEFIKQISSSDLANDKKCKFIECIVGDKINFTTNSNLTIEGDQLCIHAKGDEDSKQITDKYSIIDNELLRTERSIVADNGQWYTITKFDKSGIVSTETSNDEPIVTITDYVNGGPTTKKGFDFSGMPSNHERPSDNSELERFKHHLAAEIMDNRKHFNFISLIDIDRNYMKFMPWLEVYSRWAGYTITKQPNEQYHDLCIKLPK